MYSRRGDVVPSEIDRYDKYEAPELHTAWSLGDAMPMKESRYLGHRSDSFYTRYLRPADPRLPGQWQAEEAALALWNQNSTCSLYVWRLCCEELAVQLSIGKACNLTS